MHERDWPSALSLIGWTPLVPVAGDAAKGDGAIVHSPHFTIQNLSGATDQALQTATTILEQAYMEVATLLGVITSREQGLT